MIAYAMINSQQDLSKFFFKYFYIELKQHFYTLLGQLTIKIAGPAATGSPISGSFSSPFSPHPTIQNRKNVTSERACNNLYYIFENVWKNFLERQAIFYILNCNHETDSNSMKMKKKKAPESNAQWDEKIAKLKYCILFFVLFSFLQVGRQRQEVLFLFPLVRTVRTCYQCKYTHMLVFFRSGV